MIFTWDAIHIFGTEDWVSFSPDQILLTLTEFIATHPESFGIVLPSKFYASLPSTLVGGYINNPSNHRENRLAAAKILLQQRNDQRLRWKNYFLGGRPVLRSPIDGYIDLLKSRNLETKSLIDEAELNLS